MVKITINNKELHVQEGATILEAARQSGIKIPTLCFLKDINDIGACRMCVVEIEGEDRLATACNTAVAEGMVIQTHSRRVMNARRTNLGHIMSQHDARCPSCPRDKNCALQDLCDSMNMRDIPYGSFDRHRLSDAGFPIVKNDNKCIKCMRCVSFCDKIQTMNIWDVIGTGGNTHVGVHGGQMKDSDCVLCGQCVTHCPVGALYERDDTLRVVEALEDPEVITLVQVAPAVRAAWGETFGLSREFATTERLASALRAVGFDHVFDTVLSADLTIMEEGSELIQRLNTPGSKLPLLTSCCPGWVRFIKTQYPSMVDNLSTAKSPQGMFGAVMKSYYAEVLGVDPHKIFSVSIMPCTAKKHECAIPNLNDATGDTPDVDVVLTTREVDRLIKMFDVDVPALHETEFDQPLDLGTGAGVIFGATGGVMEAALRSAYFLVTGKNPDADAFRQVRGMDGWKEAEFDIAGITLRVAVSHGLGNTRKLMEAIRLGQVHYDFVEVMACPGGCVGGGGQPIHDGEELAGTRSTRLYDLDRAAELRFSHENPSVLKLYADYMEKPLSERAHHLLHTDHHGWKMPSEK